MSLLPQVFRGVGGLAFTLINPMFPEIQSLTKAPAVSNGYKGLAATFALSAAAYPAVACAGYWCACLSIVQACLVSNLQ